MRIPARKVSSLLLITLIIIGCTFMFLSLNYMNEENDRDNFTSKRRSDIKHQKVQDSHGDLYRREDNAPIKTYMLPHGDCDIRSILTEEYTNEVSLQSLNKCHRIIYNRVPKCGSRSVLTTLRLTAKKNNITSVDVINWNNYNHFPRDEIAAQFVNNFTGHQTPLLYSQHLHYLDMTRFKAVQPVYINVIRDPLERIISEYYYSIYGSSNDPKISSASLSLDTCIATKKDACVRFNVILPYFCGHWYFCRHGGFDALQEAKKVITRDFAVVGTTEELPSLFKILEILMPRFFKGASNVYEQMENNMKKKFSTSKKAAILPETEEFLRHGLRHEQELYQFVLQRYQHLLSTLNLK